MRIENRSLFIFRLFNVDVFIHWTWAIGAVFEIWRSGNLTAANHPSRSIGFYSLQYLCLFAIILVHEFGHALACKSVGGRADRITLWPLGGLTFVKPPQRPGAFFWSILAGPLMNMILLPFTIIPAIFLLRVYGPDDIYADFVYQLAFINVIILAFNLLPIYPLDGGQMLRALFWFVVGRGKSLVAAAVIGVAGAIGLGILAILYAQSAYLGIVIAFMAIQSFRAIKIGMTMIRIEKNPRRLDASCPSCRQSPPIGAFWKCACTTQFDTFATNSHCPGCGKIFNITACPLCSVPNLMPLWYTTGGFAVIPHVAAPASA